MTPETFERLTGHTVVDVIAKLAGLEGKLTLTPEETFKLLGWSRTKGYEELKTGRLPAKKVKGLYVISTAGLLLWLLDFTPNGDG